MFMLYDHQGIWNSCSHEIEIQTNKKLTAKKHTQKNTHTQQQHAHAHLRLYWGGGGGEVRVNVIAKRVGACEKSTVKFMGRLLEHFVGFGALRLKIKKEKKKKSGG